jgi:hypothetical protein
VVVVDGEQLEAAIRAGGVEEGDQVDEEPQCDIDEEEYDDEDQ